MKTFQNLRTSASSTLLQHSKNSLITNLLGNSKKRPSAISDSPCVIQVRVLSIHQGHTQNSQNSKKQTEHDCFSHILFPTLNATEHKQTKNRLVSKLQNLAEFMYQNTSPSCLKEKLISLESELFWVHNLEKYRLLIRTQGGKKLHQILVACPFYWVLFFKMWNYRNFNTSFSQTIKKKKEFVVWLLRL